jgi:hypothetical protein
MIRIYDGADKNDLFIIINFTLNLYTLVNYIFALIEEVEWNSTFFVKIETYVVLLSGTKNDSL